MSVLNILNPSPGNLEAAAVQGITGKVMPPSKPVQAVGTAGATAPPQRKGKKLIFKKKMEAVPSPISSPPLLQSLKSCQGH